MILIVNNDYLVNNKMFTYILILSFIVVFLHFHNGMLL